LNEAATEIERLLGEGEGRITAALRSRAEDLAHLLDESIQAVHGLLDARSTELRGVMDGRVDEMRALLDG
ncbi:hypothetical protein, partial [Klebsiella pneumoniae]